ncbi:MAG: GSU2403 family nucleotidyltransferase fold protein [Candidatus Methylomirabilales bacterium]
MIFSSPEAFLVHVLRAFEPYLDSLVLVGGFAVRLYEQHPRATPAATQILRTFDADLATPARLPVRGRPLAALAAAAGLQPDFRGDRIPPVMRFVFAPPSDTAEGEEEYSVEFLTPLTGPPVDRAGRVPVTSDVQTGVTAQRLRYLDLLLEMPWRVWLAGLEADREPMAVQVPHPGYFMVHKLLIAGERTREDRRAKDLAYLYQVASLFRRELPALAGEVRTRMEGPAGWRTWLGRARRQAEVLFAAPASPGVTAAHRVLAAELASQGVEVPSPAMIHAGVRLFLNGL